MSLSTRMTRRLVSVFAIMGLVLSSIAGAADPPNLIVVMVDDMGCAATPVEAGRSTPQSNARDFRESKFGAV